jgi:hypothetical protein
MEEITVAVWNRSQQDDNEVKQKVTNGLKAQVTRDFSPSWGTNVEVVFFSK